MLRQAKLSAVKTDFTASIFDLIEQYLRLLYKNEIPKSGAKDTVLNKSLLFGIVFQSITEKYRYTHDKLSREFVIFVVTI